MHIAFCEAHYDSYSGAQQSMEPLISRSDFEKTTVIVPKRGKFSDNLCRGGSELIASGFDKDIHELQSEIRSGDIITRIRSGSRLLGYYRSAFSYFKESDIDLVYCNNLTSLWLYAIPAKLAGKPVVWFVRSDSDAYSELNKIGSYLADDIILISKGVSSRFGAQSVSLLSDKFKVINTGIDISEFVNVESVEHDEGPINITHVGTIQPRKGQKTLVEAVDSVSDQLPDFRLRFAGSVSAGHEDYYKSLTEMIRQSSITDEVELLGYREDIPKVLGETDMVVLPSTSEGLPRAVLEASATGTPCITTRVGGAEEIITDGVDGFLVDVDDDDTLARRITELATDSELRKRMGAKAQENVTERFTVKSYVENFEAFVKSKYE